MVKTQHELGLGPEHPYGDFIQFLMFMLFFIVWILDSFIYKTLTLNLSVSIYVRLFVSGLVAVFGVYMAGRSYFVVFGENKREGLIETGVFSWVRHPMYLGGLLFLLGFVIFSFSILSFVVWCGMFVVYDWLATYEEKELVQILGEEYEKYREEVPKWGVF